MRGDVIMDWMLMLLQWDSHYSPRIVEPAQSRMWQPVCSRAR